MRRDGRVGLFVIYVAALGAVLTPAHAGDDTAYAYTWPITAPKGAAAYLVELPEQAYAWALPDADLADVVVVDAKGREVAMGPYWPAPATTHPVTMDAALLPVPNGSDSAAGPSIRRSTNGDIVIEPGAAAATGSVHEWLFDARTPIAAERVEFPPTQRDVKLTVDIDASTNLQDWQPRIAGASIVTLGHGDGAVDARVVTLAGPAARYYRVRTGSDDAPWGDGARVTLSGGVVDAAARDEAKRAWTDVASTATTASGGGADYDYKLPAALPVSAVRVALGQGDSVARLSVTAITGPVSGDSLGTIVVTPGADNRPLGFNPARRDLIRLHSPTPLRSPPRLAVGWRPDRFVFLPEGEPPYRLQVGSAGGRRAAWPIDDAMAALRTRNGAAWRPEAASLGEGHELAGRKALVGATGIDWTRPLLWIVLLLGAALVAGMAATLLRKPPPTGEDPEDAR
ncbi:DUF3999 family protein [Luteibacter yeojuensis]|uniref:DUF3999 domain-containing protein n=1 Tax=Luteibacter yeojuensis TaxID=345309 RepID=A0A0F3KQY5_9GAMM|nr:DUF3999 family protein [Luteibacter yeojuensis]KJV32534.1 hypothetical protein VI08_12440 [Luteibacter yeojuensis]